MSEELSGLIALPFITIACLAIVTGVWIGGNGGDVSWIADAVRTLAIPAILVGLLLAAGATIQNAV